MFSFPSCLEIKLLKVFAFGPLLTKAQFSSLVALGEFVMRTRVENFARPPVTDQHGRN
jgi:hypothetical protein